MEFAWKTRTEKTSVNGLPRVFFCSGKKAYDDNFDVLSGDILEYVNCVIYHVDYENIPGSMSELTDELVDDLQEMQIIVVPVTKELFTEEDVWVRDVIKAVKGKKIILPIMMGEVDLWNEFEPLFGSVQFLDKYNLYGQAKGTEISYEKKLEKRLKEFLVGDELAAKVREAFDAKIFLSYRKKDRREAQELMRLIHSDPKCESIAIWYDEFLVPGEDYNEDIKKALESSNALVFNVTQSFNEPGNYVLRVEYPAAQEQEKKIISVEMSDTDIEELEHNFKGIGDSLIKIDKHEKVCKVTLDALKGLVKDENSNDMNHTFFLGLAYKNGLEVEVDEERGNRLIERAAEGGLPEAMEEMARLCFYVRNEFETAIDWQRKAVEAFKGVIESKDDGMDAFLGFQRAVMNVMGMADAAKNYKLDWVYEIVEKVASYYLGTVMKQPEKYREQFVAMQKMRVDIVTRYLSYYRKQQDHHRVRKQKEKAEAIINDVEKWWQLCKEGEKKSIKAGTGEGKRFDDAKFVMELYCTIGKTGIYYAKAYNQLVTFEYIYDQILTEEEKCQFYIKACYNCAVWEELNPDSSKIVYKADLQDGPGWCNYIQRALELCDKHKENGELDAEWNKLYWGILSVETWWLIRVANAYKIAPDFVDLLEKSMNELWGSFNNMRWDSENDFMLRQSVVNQMRLIITEKIILESKKNDDECYKDASSISVQQLQRVLVTAKDMTEEFKNRESREFYVRQLIKCVPKAILVAEKIPEVEKIVDEAERAARELCEEEKTVQSKEWLAEAIKYKYGVYECTEEEKAKAKKEEKRLRSEVEKIEQFFEKNKMSDESDIYDYAWAKAALMSLGNMTENYKCNHADTAGEQLVKLERIKAAGEVSKLWYIRMFQCIAALKMLDKGKEIYPDWCSYVRNNRPRGIASEMYKIEGIMADLCEQAEDYENAKLHLKNMQKSLGFGVVRDKIEERIAACDEKLKG